MSDLSNLQLQTIIYRPMKPISAALNRQIFDEINRLKDEISKEDSTVNELDLIITTEGETHKALIQKMKEAETKIEPFIDIQEGLNVFL